MTEESNNSELLIQPEQQEQQPQENQEPSQPKGEQMENNEQKPEEVNSQLQGEIIHKLFENKEFVNFLITTMSSNKADQVQTSAEQNSEKLDLSKLSIDEIQAFIQRKKEEEEEEEKPETIESLNAQLMAETDLNKKMVILEKMKKALEEKAKITIPNPKPGDLVKWVNSQPNSPLINLVRIISGDVGLLNIISKFPGKLTAFCTMYDDYYDGKVTTDKAKCKEIKIWDADIEHKQAIITGITPGQFSDIFDSIISKI